MAVNFGNLSQINYEQKNDVEYIRLPRETARRIGNKTMQVCFNGNISYSDFTRQLDSAHSRLDDALARANAAAMKALNDVNSAVK